MINKLTKKECAELEERYQPYCCYIENAESFIVWVKPERIEEFMKLNTDVFIEGC